MTPLGVWPFMESTGPHSFGKSGTYSMNRPLGSTPLPPAMDLRAPDGSEIRLLTATSRGSMVHCTLPPGGVSQAMRHRTVEEVWHFLAGRGEVWRRLEGQEEVTPVAPGISLAIPLGAKFQFRNPGAEPLVFLIVTMPPWPGEREAEPVRGPWQENLRPENLRSGKFRPGSPRPLE